MICLEQFTFQRQHSQQNSYARSRVGSIRIWAAIGSGNADNHRTAYRVLFSDFSRSSLFQFVYFFVVLQNSDLVQQTRQAIRQFSMRFKWPAILHTKRKQILPYSTPRKSSCQQLLLNHVSTS